jgi:protein-S-isoprenylcysteine O-methyltransferase Ste14
VKNIQPYLLPAVLILGVILLSCNKILYHNEIWRGSVFNCDFAIISLYLLWMMYEVRVSHNDVVQEKEVSDYGTQKIYGFSHALTILSALWFNPVWQAPGAYHAAGFLLLVSGACFRLRAIASLGIYYSHVVRKIEGHKIIDTGPYRYLRHPAYAGMIAAHLGITVFYFNYITCAIFVLLLIPSIIVRILVEEKTLMTIKGYEDFSKNRKRIIPFVW